MTWRPFYVGIGSNLDDPKSQIRRAMERLRDLPESHLVLVSPMYASAPAGGVEQPDFVNAVAAGVTRLSPGALLGELQSIENDQGRVRDGQRWGPRTLDLDLLVYGSVTSDEPELTLPHPRIGERNFVLLPLKDIAPDLVVPGLGRVAAIAVDKENPRISRLE